MSLSRGEPREKTRNSRKTGGRNSKSRLQAGAHQLVLDALRDGVLVASSATENLVFANASICRMLGYSRAELLALKPVDLHPPGFRSFTVTRFEELRAGQTDAVHGIPTIRKDGTVFISDISVASVTIDGRSLLIGTFRDVTRMRQERALLRAREARLSRAESMAAVGHFAFDGDGSNLICSDGLKKIYGFDPDSNPLFAEFRARIHPEDAQWIAPEFAKRMQERRGYTAEYRIVRPDGSEVQVVTTAEVEIVEPADQPRWFGTVIDVTARKRREAALRESEERVRRVIEATNDGVWDWNILTHEIYHSPRWEQILGYAPGELPHIDSAFFDRLHPDDKPAVEEALGRHFAGSGPFSAEFRVRHKDGSWRWVLSRGKAVLDSGGRAVRMTGSITDITDRKLTEAALRDNEDLFRRVIEATNDGVWDWNLLTHEDYHSPRWEQIVGYAPGELPHVDSTFFSLLHPADKPAVEEALRRHFEENEPYIVELRLRHKDGTWRWLRSRGKAVFDSGGQPVRMTGAVTDITEEKAGAEALAATENRLALVLNNIFDGFFTMNREWRYLDVNPAAARMVGHLPEELIGHVYQEVFPEARGTIWEQTYAKVMSTPEAVTVEDFYGPLGMWFEANVFPYSGGISVFFRDITLRKQAQRELQSERDRLRQILDSQFGFVAVLSPDGRVVEVNQMPLTLMRLRRADVLGRPFWEIGWLKPGTEQISQDAIRRAAQGEVVRVDIAGQFPGSRPRHLDGVFSPIRDDAGNITDVIAFGVDITDRKQAEELAREREASLNMAQEIGQIGSWSLDLVSGRLTWSDEVFRIFEIDKESFAASYEAFLDLVYPEDRPTVDERYTDSLKTRQPYETVHRLRMRDGRIKFVFERCRTEFAEDGRPLRSLGTIQDITEKKRAEDLIRSQLREKEILLREIHHRVKNNLQIISSLLHLQSAASQDAAVARLVEDSRRRIHAMASIHEILYQSDDLGRVEIAPYFRKLVSALQATQTQAGRDIQVLTHVSVAYLDIQRAIPCGLIVTELTSNAFKHAFEGRDKGTLRVTLREAAPGWLILAVQDDGGGLPAAANQTPRGFGLRLVQLLAEQIGGTLETSSGPGAELFVSFPAVP